MNFLGFHIDPAWIDIFRKNIYYSPIILHGIAITVSSLHWLLNKWLRYVFESRWDILMFAILFLNPFLAFFATSFWMIWLQTLILSLPLFFMAIYYRQTLLDVSYHSDRGYAILAGVILYFVGHVLSLGVFLIKRFFI